MAKMSKRTDNRFEIKVPMGGGKRLSVYGATEAEARRKAKELREMSAKYDMSSVCRMSVKDYMVKPEYRDMLRLKMFKHLLERK